MPLKEIEIAPVISIAVDGGSIVIRDNGTRHSGGPTIKGVLDYAIRVSSREAYVSPDTRCPRQRPQDNLANGVCPE